MKPAADPVMAAIRARVGVIRGALHAAGVASGDLDDLTQEVVLMCWLQLRGKVDDGAPASLLWVIAWRTGRDWRQRCDTRERYSLEPLKAWTSLAPTPTIALKPATSCAPCAGLTLASGASSKLLPRAPPCPRWPSGCESPRPRRTGG